MQDADDGEVAADNRNTDLDFEKHERVTKTPAIKGEIYETHFVKGTRGKEI